MRHSGRATSIFSQVDRVSASNAAAIVGHRTCSPGEASRTADAPSLKGGSRARAQKSASNGRPEGPGPTVGAARRRSAKSRQPRKVAGVDGGRPAGSARRVSSRFPPNAIASSAYLPPAYQHQRQFGQHHGLGLMSATAPQLQAHAVHQDLSARAASHSEEISWRRHMCQIGVSSWFSIRAPGEQPRVEPIRKLLARRSCRSCRSLPSGLLRSSPRCVIVGANIARPVKCAETKKS